MLLPSDLPDARITTHGYDADVAHFFAKASRSRIGDHANTLLGDLARMRERTETVDCTEGFLRGNKANADVL